jgi:hypothetical protein
MSLFFIKTKNYKEKHLTGFSRKKINWQENSRQLPLPKNKSK